MSIRTIGEYQRAVFEAAGAGPAVFIPPILAGPAASTMLVGSVLVDSMIFIELSGKCNSSVLTRWIVVLALLLILIPFLDLL